MGVRISTKFWALAAVAACTGSKAAEKPVTPDTVSLQTESFQVKPQSTVAPAVAEVRPADPPSPEYPLDHVSRKVPMTGPMQCPPVELVSYAGEVVPFSKSAKVYVDFVDHLRRFETIVRDTSVEVYGRAPTSITHEGAYYCRRIRRWPYLISEHGLGNAIDVSAFEFARLSGPDAKDVPARWRGKFRVSMSKHWTASGASEVHREFLHLLARRVIDGDKLFRVILGPADPKHASHFHFDMAPFRIVNVF